MKKLFKKKLFKSTDKVRVRNSYYTFSEQYPKGYIISKSYKSRRKAGKRKSILSLCLFVVLLLTSFFVMDLALKISYHPIEENRPQHLAETVPFNKNDLLSEGFKALYMPCEHLGDTEYIESFIKEIEKKDANSVVIDFKTDEGRLCYSSINEHAIAAKASLFDNDTVRKALSLFSSKGINVAARIVCFKDNAAATATPSMAVKYMDTDINWLDGTDENGGKAWLNPFSKLSRDYNVSVAKELRSFGINIFLLDCIQFPESDNLAGAFFPSETVSGRNKILKTFLHQINTAVGSDALVFLMQNSTDTLTANETKYSGTMNNADVSGIVLDTTDRDISFVIDKKSDFSQILSFYSSVNQAVENKTIVPIIETKEYSYSYRRSLEKNGYNSFIIFNAEGEY